MNKKKNKSESTKRDKWGTRWLEERTQIVGL